MDEHRQSIENGRAAADSRWGCNSLVNILQDAVRSAANGSATNSEAEPAPESQSVVSELQVNLVASAMPLLLMFHACATISIFRFNSQCNVSFVCQGWHWLAALVGAGFAGFVLLWWHWQKSGQSLGKAEFALHLLELLCLLLGLVWAMPAAAYVASQNSYPILPIIGISLAMMGVAVVSLLRVPVGATVFVSLMTTTLAYCSYLALQQFNLIAAFVCIIYGLVLIGLVVQSHLEFKRRTTAEQEVRHQQQVIKLLLNDFERGTSDWLWETNGQGFLTYYSPRLAEILNFAADELQGRSLREALSGFADATSWHDLETALAKRASIAALPLTLSRQGFAAHWEISAQALQDGNGDFAGFRGVGRDVTAKHYSEKNLQAAVADSEKASSAKSQFLSIISHELRTPINAIVGFAELLRFDGDSPLSANQHNEYCDTILDNARSLQSMINDLLDATRLESGALHLVDQDNDTAELVETIVRLHAHQAEQAEITILCKTTDGISLRGDVMRLKQVITNLIANAIKFSPRGGLVHVEMLRGSDDQFVLQIRDAGVGIPQNELESVFETFAQAECGSARRFGGVGLGLAIARRVARLHGGDVTLDSVYGAGTTAHLTLPANRIKWTTSPVLASQPDKQVA